MKILYIVIIVLIIFCLSSSVSALFFLRKQNIETNNAVNQYNKNIDDYNMNYNMNYQNNKVYYDQHLRKMLGTMATVIDNPRTEEIKVNDKTITIYTVKIEYEILNYLDERTGKITAIGGKVVTNKKQDTLIEKPIKVISEIITTKQIEKDDMFTVYYNYNTDRIAPPFLSEKYITYLNKI